MEAFWKNSNDKIEQEGVEQDRLIKLKEGEELAFYAGASIESPDFDYHTLLRQEQQEEEIQLKMTFERRTLALINPKKACGPCIRLLRASDPNFQTSLLDSQRHRIETLSI